MAFNTAKCSPDAKSPCPVSQVQDGGGGGGGRQERDGRAVLITTLR
jgi:hypothetical protein